MKFVGQSQQGQSYYHFAEDIYRLMAPWFREETLDREREGDDPPNLVTVNTGFVGAQGTDFGVGLLQAVWCEEPEFMAGTNSRFAIYGGTVDQYGSPLGGVTVKLFRTSDDCKLDQVVSGPTGCYLVSTPYYPDYHYIVEYKAGSPDVFGTSPNNLIAS